MRSQPRTSSQPPCKPAFPHLRSQIQDRHLLDPKLSAPRVAPASHRRRTAPGPSLGTSPLKHRSAAPPFWPGALLVPANYVTVGTSAKPSHSGPITRHPLLRLPHSDGSIHHAFFKCFPKACGWNSRLPPPGSHPSVYTANTALSTPNTAT